MTSVQANLPPLVGVRDQLVQVFLNLVLNAIDATQKGGRIELATAPHAEGIAVTVCDNGCGISAEHQKRLFQPYFTTKKHGTGLGLFVTQKLVSDHGGRIEYESRVGAGTLFRVLLPLASASQG